MKSENSKVVIVSIEKSIKNAVEEAFNQFGGVAKYIPEGKIIIKVNGVHFTDYSYTDPLVLNAVLNNLIKNGANPNKIYVIESCTSGLFTRMVFKISGLAAVCKKNNINIIYMDEGPVELIKLGKEQYTVEISKFAYEELINPKNRKNNVYIEIPKLKTHWCTKVTLGIKLQLGFLRDISKAVRHHYYHNDRLVDIFEVFQPDLCIIDAISGIAVGPCPPQNADIIMEYIYDYNLILMSDDIVAIDAIGSKILGLQNLEVQTTKIAHERGLGMGDVDNIEIITKPEMNINSLIQQVPWELKKIFPDNVDIIYGNELACFEGCVGLTLIYLELLTLENPSIKDKVSFTLLFGKGFDKNKLDNLKEPVCLMGSCCVEEIGEFIKSKYKSVREVNLCGNLGQYSNLLLTVTGIDALSQVPTDKFSLPELLWQLIISKVNKLSASLPELPTEPQILDIVSSSLNSISKETLQDPEFRKTLESLMVYPNENVRSNTMKIVVKMANSYDIDFLDIVENSLHDDSKKVLKTTLKEIFKVSKKNQKLMKKLKPTIERLKEINKDKSTQKIIGKILG